MAKYGVFVSFDLEVSFHELISKALHSFNSKPEIVAVRKVASSDLNISIDAFDGKNYITLISVEV
ncbi:hypothetical protein [Paenibacillus agilis]|uniref:Uncharacterized protein n=1 Tax=Paenibacillus agilis TaxID=3020863 RepID=A0A559IE85_9BACL|nr:hypothetical protein [Paenibacillus agilis]TVX85964.1 hypothetical protein FPZ44_23715 [Paenibacillus agilis]